MQYSIAGINLQAATEKRRPETIGLFAQQRTEVMSK
jgi:hypothetical protein